MQIGECDKELQHIDQLIEIKKKSQSSDSKQAISRLVEIESDIGINNGSLYKSRNELVQLENDCERIKQLENLQGQISSLVNQSESQFNSSLKALKNEIANEYLRQLQIQLAQKNAILTDAMMQNNIIASVEANIKELELQLVCADAVAKELSPTEGLIAEGLLGFIKNYTSKMNVLISRIWTYRLEVLGCKQEEGDTFELDYKFPFMIEGNNDPISDVSKGSTGQKEIIDLSFKIVAMNCLGMSNYPLILDELGSGMDPEHKTQVVNLIKFLIEQCSFSQIFIVSHDYAQYGSLGNMQTCVICSKNIVVPDKYNEHVLIQ